MPRRKNEKSSRPRGKRDQELEALYARMRKEFTAADLQKYTEVEDGIPAEQVLAEMEAIHRKTSRKRG